MSINGRLWLDIAGRQLIRVAPNPALAGFDGAHQRMTGLLEVLGGMLILRRVATSDMTAAQAQSQMHPAVADLDAVFANVFVRASDLDLIQMAAAYWHLSSYTGAGSGRAFERVAVPLRQIRARFVGGLQELH
jgi:hypothetical protein